MYYMELTLTLCHVVIHGAWHPSENKHAMLYFGVFSDHCVTLAVVLSSLLSLWVWMILALCQSFVDEDVSGPASAPLLDLCPYLSYYAGPQAGLQDPLELVPHLPPCLDLWHHPHSHADREDGRALQAWLWPPGWRAEPKKEVVVPDGFTPEGGFLSNTVLPPGEAHWHVGQCGVYPSVGAAGWGAGGAGTQRFPLQEGLKQRSLQYMALNCNIGDKNFLHPSISFSRCTNTICWIKISTNTDVISGSCISQVWLHHIEYCFFVNNIIKFTVSAKSCIGYSRCRLSGSQ